MKRDLTAAGLALLLVLGVSSIVYAGTAADNDSDGVYNVLDNCKAIPNGIGPPARDCDKDNDGYGNRCDCDYDQDGDCDVPDFNTFKQQFTGAAPVGTADSDCDGDVDVPDFNNFKSGFGGAVGTMDSGLHCAGHVPCDL